MCNVRMVADRGSIPRTMEVRLVGTPTRNMVRIALLACVIALSLPGVAQASETRPGRGVGTARIGHSYAKAAAAISSIHRTVKDTNYAYVVYRTNVGRKMSNGRYPVVLYSKSNKRVFRFQVNSIKFPTSKRVRVGSPETAVTAAYPSAKGPYTSGQYRRYTLKHTFYSYATYTDFYCKGDKVSFMVVRR